MGQFAGKKWEERRRAEDGDTLKGAMPCQSWLLFNARGAVCVKHARTLSVLGACPCLAFTTYVRSIFNFPRARASCCKDGLSTPSRRECAAARHTQRQLDYPPNAVLHRSVRKFCHGQWAVSVPSLVGYVQRLLYKDHAALKYQIWIHYGRSSDVVGGPRGRHMLLSDSRTASFNTGLAHQDQNPGVTRRQINSPNGITSAVIRAYPRRFMTAEGDSARVLLCAHLRTRGMW
jgi:hypothetical protein